MWAAVSLVEDLRLPIPRLCVYSFLAFDTLLLSPHRGKVGPFAQTVRFSRRFALDSTRRVLDDRSLLRLTNLPMRLVERC